MTQKVVLASGDGRRIAGVSEAELALVVVPAIHERIHDGEMFQADHIAEAVADDGVINLLIQGAAGVIPNFRLRADTGGTALLTIFEGTTFSVAGTGVTEYNRNRASLKVSGLTITHTPTITLDGTELSEVLIPGGSGGNAQGGQDDGFQEWILAANIDYMVRLKNIAGVAADLGTQLNYYVHGAVAP